jgi:hypothetical protein
MEIEIRDNGKYELTFFGRVYVLTREQLDELHDLIETVNKVEHDERERLPRPKGWERGILR